MAIDSQIMEEIRAIIANELQKATSLQAATRGIAKGVTQYIGARYVPVFANPITWTNDRAYEPLTIVLYQGNSYTTRQFTPVGVDITNEEFWAQTGNYNAQLEMYRQEVAQLDSLLNDTVIPTMNENTNKITNLNRQTNGDDESWLKSSQSYVNRISPGTFNAMLACAYTYVDACKAGKLKYGDGTGVHQKIGEISCSTFIRQILLGIPFSDYLAGNAKWTSASATTNHYGYKMRDYPFTDATATAKQIYDAMNDLHYVVETDSNLSNALPGDIVFLSEDGTTEKIWHVMMVVARKPSHCYVIDASSRHADWGVRVSRANTYTGVVALARPQMTHVEFELPNHESVVIENGYSCDVEPGKYNELLFEYDVVEDGSISIGSISLSNQTKGRGASSVVLFPSLTTNSGATNNIENVKFSCVQTPYGHIEHPIVSGNDAFIISHILNNNYGDVVIAVNGTVIPNGVYNLSVAHHQHIKTATLINTRTGHLKLYHADFSESTIPSQFFPVELS